MIRHDNPPFGLLLIQMPSAAAFRRTSRPMGPSRSTRRARGLHLKWTVAGTRGGGRLNRAVTGSNTDAVGRLWGRGTKFLNRIEGTATKRQLWVSRAWSRRDGRKGRGNADRRIFTIGFLACPLFLSAVILPFRVWLIDGIRVF